MRTLLVRVGFALGLAVSMAACATKEPTVVHSTVLLTPADSLIQDCPVAAPPARDTFLAASDAEKIKALSAWGNQQTLNVGLCNKDKAGLREWKSEEVRRHKGTAK